MNQVQNSFGPPTATRVEFLNIISKRTTFTHTIMYKVDRGHANDHIRKTGKGTVVEVTEPSVLEFTRVHSSMNLSLDGASYNTIYITFFHPNFHGWTHITIRRPHNILTFREGYNVSDLFQYTYREAVLLHTRYVQDLFKMKYPTWVYLEGVWTNDFNGISAIVTEFHFGVEPLLLDIGYGVLESNHMFGGPTIYQPNVFNICDRARERRDKETFLYLFSGSIPSLPPMRVLFLLLLFYCQGMKPLLLRPASLFPLRGKLLVVFSIVT